jgi:hypothetical protein
MKKVLLISLAILVILVILVLGARMTGPQLVKTHDRVQTYTLPKEVREELSDIYMTEPMDIIRYSIKYTAYKLEFSEKNDLNKGNANCVGYAQYCSAVANFISRNSGLGNIAKPVVGIVKYNGMDLCQFVSSKMPSTKLKNFTKDHDFVEFLVGNSVVYADPCLYDLTGDECRTWK